MGSIFKTRLSYVPLEAAASDDTENPHTNANVVPGAASSNHHQRKYIIIPWLTSLALFLVLVSHSAKSRAYPTSNAGWGPHEIKAATREIPLRMKEVTFTGTLKIDDEMGLIREIDPNLPAYVGLPTPEMDILWDDLVHPLNAFITEEELEGDTEGTSPDPETGLYVAMPQGFHDLHCLNYLRKRIYLEHYPYLIAMNRSELDVHIDHCIDSLRQSLMCTGDMTLIKTYWIEDRHRMMCDFDNTHICRDLGPMKHWLRERDAEDAHWRKSAEKLLGKSSKMV